MAGAAVLGVPLLFLLAGIGARQATRLELESLRTTNDSLKVENDSYREATGELTVQISSLQAALAQLSEQSQLDATTREAIQKLPAMIRSRAMGGGAVPNTLTPPKTEASTPQTTFGMLKDVLGVLEGSLASVKTKVDNQQALARATPSIWPIAGWLSSGYGNRADPFTGQPDFHAGLDISADKGTPVRATADGVVELAAYNGNYGNCIMISHGFGIGTRFGHLSGYAVGVGQKVKRGDVIGYVGSTGRATSSHLHYEILLNGSPINPLKILARP
ncbi:MAG TPA: peptidoglycan DD-metalloendopeptidase family protein [Vicinamibacterales bacterium]|nr:peptidoglycan DD-metalloendopeptidase family protein [Vicinamibacterales bacterium]